MKTYSKLKHLPHLKLCLLVVLIINSTFLSSQNISFEEILPSNGGDFTNILDGTSTFADVDGDGDEDLLITGSIDGSNSNNVTELYINNGTGHFSLVTGTPFIAVTQSSVAFADIDGDNDLDVLIVGKANLFPASNRADLYRNNGQGVFTLITGTPFVGRWHAAVAFADVDGDGDQDVAISGDQPGGGSTDLYTNNGSGVFTLVAGTPFVDLGHRPEIVFADIDGDNDSDLFVVGEHPWGSNRSALYKNNGLGSFTLATAPPSSVVEGASVDFADIDGDNDLDLLISATDFFTPKTNLYTNDGTGNYTRVSPLPFIRVWGSVAFFDMDNDNDQDVIITGRNSLFQFETKLYSNNGLGVYTLVPGTSFIPVYVSSIDIADVDGDNDLDIVMTGASGNYSNPITQIYINDSVGNFSMAPKTLFEGLKNGEAIFSDTDGDSDRDLLITGENTNNQPNSKIFLNDSLGNLSEINTILENVSDASIASADIDGDNDQDVLIIGQNTSNQSIAKLYINNGTGLYSLVSGTPFTGVKNGSLNFADIDNDGDQDVLITGSNSSNQSSSKLYTNNGVGLFSLVPNTPFDAIYESAVAFSDIDGDNDQDVLISGRGTSNIPITKLYLNNGFGSYSLVSGTPFDNIHGGDVAFSDIDNDDDEDLLITGENNLNQPISKLYLNDGSGMFSVLLGTPFDALRESTIEFSDVDMDADEDILISGLNSSNSPFTKLYRNNGLGIFSLVSGLPFIAISNGDITSADIDGDNDQDVLILGENNLNKFITKLYENKTCVSNSIDTVISCYQYTWSQNNITYTESGLYYDTLLNSANCDSLVILKLTIPKKVKETTVNACVSYNWRGNLFTSSGTYYDTVSFASSCDSIYILTLSIDSHSSDNDSIIACDNYISPQGKTYTANGIYLDTIPNSTGCDSIITTHLIINQSYSSTDTITSCNNYTWIQNGVTYTNSGLYSDTLSTISGCDSISYLYLTIFPPFISIDTIHSCNNYFWTQNGITYSAGGFFSDSLVDQNGCDSIIAIQLTIDTTNNTISQSGFTLTSNQQSAAYQWLDCGNNHSPIINATSQSFIATSNGDYSVEITTNNCIDTSQCINILNVSNVEIAENSNLLTFSPNPTKGVLSVQHNDSKDSKELLFIYNVDGKLVLSSTIKPKLDLSSFENGVYFIHYKKMVKKIILNK